MSPFLPFCCGSLSDEFELVSRSFDENFLRRLQTLTTTSFSSSWLSLAVGFLKSTHLEAQALVSSLKSTRSDSGYRSSDDDITLYMIQIYKLFTFCRVILRELHVLIYRYCGNDIDLVFALKFLSEGGQMSVPEKLRKARDSLDNWENKLRRVPPSFVEGKDVDLGVLIGDLVMALRRPPRGKISSARKLIRRTFYAVGLATVFVAGVVASSVYGLTDIGGVQAPAEFMWAESFNHLQSAMSDEMKKRRRCLAGVDDLEAHLVGVGYLFDDALSRDGNEKDVVRLRSVVNELKTVSAKVSIGLDSLHDNIDGLHEMFMDTLISDLKDFIGHSFYEG